MELMSVLDMNLVKNIFKKTHELPNLTESDNKAVISTEEDLINIIKTADQNGFLHDDDKKQLTVYEMSEKRKKLDRKRALKWAVMVLNWDTWIKKKTKKSF